MANPKEGRKNEKKNYIKIILVLVELYSIVLKINVDLRYMCVRYR